MDSIQNISEKEYRAIPD